MVDKARAAHAKRGSAGSGGGRNQRTKGDLEKEITDLRKQLADASKAKANVDGATDEDDTPSPPAIKDLVAIEADVRKRLGAEHHMAVAAKKELDAARAKRLEAQQPSHVLRQYELRLEKKRKALETARSAEQDALQAYEKAKEATAEAKKTFDELKAEAAEARAKALQAPAPQESTMADTSLGGVPAEMVDDPAWADQVQQVRAAIAVVGTMRAAHRESQRQAAAAAAPGTGGNSTPAPSADQKAPPASQQEGDDDMGVTEDLAPEQADAVPADLRDLLGGEESVKRLLTVAAGAGGLGQLCKRLRTKRG